MLAAEKPECAPDLARERRHRSLAAGAGHGSNGSRLTRVELGRDQRQCTAGIGNADESGAAGERRVRGTLGHNRYCSSRDCRVDKAQAVGLAAGNGDEQIAAFDSPAVSGHAADLKLGMARVRFRVRRQYLAKLHGGSVDSAATAYLLSFSDASIC